MIRGSWKDKTYQKTRRTAHQNEVERWQWSKDGTEKRNPAVQEEEVRSSLLFMTLCGRVDTSWVVLWAARSQGICQLCYGFYKREKQKHETELNLPEGSCIV